MLKNKTIGIEKYAIEDCKMIRAKETRVVMVSDIYVEPIMTCCQCIPKS
jgi:hypothetical protein